MKAIAKRCSVCHVYPNRNRPKVIVSGRCPTLHIYCEKCFAAQPDTFTCASPFCDQILSKSDFKVTPVDSQEITDRVTATSKRIKCPLHKRVSVSVCPAPKCPQGSRLICPYCIEENIHGRCMDRYHICAFLLQAKPIMFSTQEFSRAIAKLQGAGLQVNGLPELSAYAKQVAEEALEIPIKKELAHNLDITLSKEGQLFFKTARVTEIERLISAIASIAKEGVAQATLEDALKPYDKYHFLSFGLRKELISHDNVYRMHQGTVDVIQEMNRKLTSDTNMIRNNLKATLPRADAVRAQLAPVRDFLVPLKTAADDLRPARNAFEGFQKKHKEMKKTIENVIEQRVSDRSKWMMLREAGYLQETSGPFMQGQNFGSQWMPPPPPNAWGAMGTPPTGF